MPFQFAPPSCAPYCFPAGEKGATDVTMIGCIKYCTPIQYEREHSDHTKPPTVKQSPCKCTMVKRLDCWRRVDTGESVLQCGQFKMLQTMSDPDNCQQVCAGQLISF